MQQFFTHVNELSSSFDPLLALAVFFVYIVTDGLYALYTLSVSKELPARAASFGAIMHFFLAFGVINYVNNFLYVIPLAAGSWVGTYLCIKFSKSYTKI
jgi:hypothetical protein